MFFLDNIVGSLEISTDFWESLLSCTKVIQQHSSSSGHFTKQLSIELQADATFSPGVRGGQCTLLSDSFSLFEWQWEWFEPREEPLGWGGRGGSSGVFT
jgi:hypothetical protein